MRSCISEGGLCKDVVIGMRDTCACPESDDAAGATAPGKNDAEAVECAGADKRMGIDGKEPVEADECSC